MMRLPSLFMTIQSSSGGYFDPLGSEIDRVPPHRVVIAPLVGSGTMGGGIDELKNGTHTFPSSLEAVTGDGVSDPVPSAPSPVPSASVKVTKRNLLEGRLASKCGIDKADQS